MAVGKNIFLVDIFLSIKNVHFSNPKDGLKLTNRAAQDFQVRISWNTFHFCRTPSKSSRSSVQTYLV